MSLEAFVLLENLELIRHAGSIKHLVNRVHAYTFQKEIYQVLLPVILLYILLHLFNMNVTDLAPIIQILSISIWTEESFLQILLLFRGLKSFNYLLFSLFLFALFPPRPPFLEVFLWPSSVSES